MQRDSENAVAQPDAATRWASFERDMHAATQAFAEIEPGTTPYALVDTRGLPDLRTALNRLGNIPFAALWDGSDLEQLKDISPLLIRLELNGDAASTARQLQRRLWDFSDGEFMLTWLWSPLPLDALAQHFRAYCEYTLPDQRAFYLHFYDNRNLERLHHVWTEDEWQGFAGVALEMWYRDREGRDASWSNESELREHRDEPLTLSESQHQALLRLGQVDKLAMQLRMLHEIDLAHLTPSALREAITEQLKRAKQQRVSDDDDLLTYVSAGVRCSPTFDRHPEVQRILNNILAEPGMLARGFASLPEEVFVELRQEPNHLM